MQGKVSQLRQLKNEAFIENLEIGKIKSSDEYVALSEQIKELADKQSIMIPEASKAFEYEALKREIMDEMNSTRDYSVEGLVAKFTEKKEVNQSKLIEVLDGDFGLFQELASVTQKNIKDFAKTQPGLKKPLLNCIEVVSRTLKDVEIINNEEKI